jgi:hypothetical protein
MHDDFEVTRRRFLRLGSDAFILSLLVGSGIVPVSRPAFAGEMQVLSKEQANTLLAVARTLFPHDNVADGYYMNVVAAIDVKCAQDDKTRSMVVEGLARLNRAIGMPFAEASESARENLLRTMEKSPFFQLAYGEALNGLYGNHEIWKMLGYEGSSVEYGGYLGRGFDDIDWLPNS